MKTLYGAFRVIIALSTIFSQSQCRHQSISYGETDEKNSEKMVDNSARPHVIIIVADDLVLIPYTQWHSIREELICS